MRVIVHSNITAYIFSTKSIRDAFVVPKGDYKLLDVKTTSWGEIVLTLENLPSLISATYWGPTPFGLSIDINYE